MKIIYDLLARVEGVKDGLSSGQLIRDVVMNHEKDILEMQKQQLFEGKASSGDDMRPYYSEDIKPGGYFYSVDSAQRYANRKLNDISYPAEAGPYSAKRNADAPNLYINGKFHSELGVNFGPDVVEVNGKTSYAGKIVSKYGLGKFGLTNARWNELFREKGAFNELIKEIKAELYGN